MTRYFITGAQGFVGRYLISHILTSVPDDDILGIGRSPRRDKTFTHSVRWGMRSPSAPLPAELRDVDEKRYRYISADIHERARITALLREFRPDIILHMASGLRDDMPSSLLKTNIEGTMNLLEAVADANIGVAKIVLGSSGGVYGPPESLPIDEDAACNPIDFYSITKLAAEHVARSEARRHHLPLICARLFNLAGPGQDERHICGRFGSQIAATLDGLAPALIEVQTLDSTRDVIDVRDAAAALGVIAKRGLSGAIYNVASGTETPMRDVLQATLEAAGLVNKVIVRQGSVRAIDIPRHVASVERLRSLGCACRYTLRQTMEDVISYYRNDVRSAALDTTGMVLAH